MEVNKPLQIVTTFPLSEKHRDSILAVAPGAVLSVYDSITEAKDSLQDVEILLTYGEDLTPEWINQCPRLKWIQVISAGLEKMPFDAIAKRGIIVTNARGIHGVPMSEYVMGMILQITHRFPQFYEQQQNHFWDRSVRIDEAAGKTVGIIGVGAIGSAIAEKAKAFGMKTLGMNTSGQKAPHIDEMFTRDKMDDVLSRSDFVVVIVPLTGDTRQMIGEHELRQMKKTAWIINVARGNVIEEQSLLRALSEKWIDGAALDVFDEEPLPAEHPLWSMENCLLTPHISGRSPKYMERAMEIFLKNLQVYRAMDGNYINFVELRKGY